MTRRKRSKINFDAHHEHLDRMGKDVPEKMTFDSFFKHMKEIEDLKPYQTIEREKLKLLKDKAAALDWLIDNKNNIDIVDTISGGVSIADSGVRKFHSGKDLLEAVQHSMENESD